MKQTLILLIVFSAAFAHAQKNHPDFVFAQNTRVSWLGVDFTHVKLIGDFSQFSGIGEKSASQIKNQYFHAWNRLIINERKKYDVAGMLRRDHVFYDVNMIDSLNDDTPLCDIESYNNPDYTFEDISKFVSAYDFKGKTGVGVLLLAESLNKTEMEGYFHFIAIDMATREILIHERIAGEPGGIGIRNYWAGSIFNIMENIEKVYYRNWRGECAKN
jgi:hypothetical protein